MSIAEVRSLLRSPYAGDHVADGLSSIVVPLGTGTSLQRDHDAGSLPVVIVGVGRLDDPASGRIFDVIVDEDDPSLAEILAVVAANPVAATSLVVLLRGSEHLPIEHALAAESAVYSLLQSGAEFARWRAADTRTPALDDDEPAVLATRDGDALSIALNRPRRHNAFSRSMRDSLDEMLSLAIADDAITRIELSGNGPSFCSGGDLGEFGTFVDPATAHTTRLTRSPARSISRIAPRTHVRLHGACMGAGIELAAFAAHVSAHPDAQIALPEIALGLVPGAGGTVSISRRVGRQRCAELALLGRAVSAQTALAWGLIDEISDR